MKLVACLVLFLFFSVSFSQNVSPQFSELKGMEDQSANTHLFYRIHTYFANDPIYEWTNHIYHLDIFTEIDTLFITASGFESPGYNFNKWVSDVDFWNNNSAEFIYCGGTTGGPYFEGTAYVRRFDGFNNTFGYFWGSANYVDISPTDDSLLYLGINTDGGFGVLKSIDGGRSWDSLSVIYQFLSLNPYYENIYFVEDWDRRLFRTTDSGITFNLVDPEIIYNNSIFVYDNDEIHIYRIADNKLKVSDNIGEQFSWETKYSLTAGDNFNISVDYSTSGTIYLAHKKNIYLSTDFGDNFNLYKTLERNIVGIYKKPSAGGGSNKLYAATKYKIYEITPDSIQVIKSLPIPDEVLNYYPLAVGNKWVYDYIIDPDDPGLPNDAGIYIREVLKDTILANGNLYAKIYDETLNYFAAIIYERVDSSSGKVYRYYEDPTLENNEYVIHDLLAEVGDTINSSRNFYNESLHTTVLHTGTFNKWGLTKPKKIYQEYSLSMLTYSLTQEVGLDSLYFIFDFGYGKTDIKGAILNEVVYGDTTVVSVEDKTPNLPTEFSLGQNYPNPFNPTTTIRFTIPTSPLNPSPYQGEGQRERLVVLKIYDVLGNEVATLVNEDKPAGSYEVEFNATSLPSGIYFYQLKTDSYIKTRKMVLLR